MSLLHTTHSTFLYPGSRLYITLPWFYITLLDSIILYHVSTLLYITLPWLYFTLLESTELYHCSTSLY